MSMTWRPGRALAVWGGILVLAFINGATREFLLFPLLGRTAGLVTSGLLLSAVILGLALLAVRWIGIGSDRQAWATGALWLSATLAFEFGFGAAVQHKSFAEMLEAYTFEAGNLWPLVLAVTLVSPLVARRLRTG